MCSIALHISEKLLAADQEVQFARQFHTGLYGVAAPLYFVAIFQRHYFQRAAVPIAF